MSVAIAAKKLSQQQRNVANATIYVEQQKNFSLQNVFYQCFIQF
jgi:hypothetical protein